MKTLIFFLLASSVFAGGNCNCGCCRPDAQPVRNTQIVVANDSSREQRWHPMLDDKDLKRLIFIRAQRETVLLYNGF